MDGGMRGIRTSRSWIVPVALVAVAAAVGAACPAAAQVGPTAPLSTLDQVPQDSPVLLEADSLTYDSRTETAIATGNATVYYGDYTVRADRITYDQKTDTVVAHGNVTITEPDGAVVTAEAIELSDALREGFIRSVSVALTNNARVAAVRGRRSGGNVTEFDNAVYTACKACEDDPSKPLTWELKAVKIRHNQLEKEVEYEDVTLEMFGQPVLYFPYFFHPDPTVRKKSGFLAPQFSSSDFYGFGTRIPYFWNIAPDYDLTIQPLITTGQGPVFDFVWRQRLADGYYTVRPTFVWQADPPSRPPGDDTFRGSIATEGLFTINERWSWGWNATAVTDDTYLRRYGFDGNTDLVSTAFLQGISDRNYFSLRGYHFQGLLEGDDDDNTPQVHPVLDHNYIFEQRPLGGELALDTTFVSLSRDSGANSTRLSSDLHWERQFISSMGHVIRPFWSLRGDIYSVDDVNNPATNLRGGSETFARFLPSAGVEYRWPLVSQSQLGTHVFEPIAQIIASPDETHENDVPNEDSRAFSFDASHLFQRNKFSGVDRFEGGTRANVGFRYTITDVFGGFSEFTFGQSYHLAGENSFGPGSGLAGDTSDFVASAYYRPNENLKLGARARFDDEDFDVKTTEVSLAAKHGRFETALTYANISSDANPIGTGNREEINFSGSFDITERWELFGNAAFDIEHSDRISEGLGIGYEDECLAVSLAYSQTHFEDRDIRPEQRVMLNFSLRTLGGTSFSRSVD